MKRNSTELKVKYHKGDKPSKKFNNRNPRLGNMGQWTNPGVPTEIPSGNITMQGVPYPVKGVDNFGNEQIMMPGADYVFPGASFVTETPIMKTGGWLEQYQGTKYSGETEEEQNPYVNDPYIGMRKFYDQAYEKLNKYLKKDKDGILSNFDKIRAWGSAAVKNPQLLFRDRYSLTNPGGPLPAISEEAMMSAENNPYRKSPVTVKTFQGISNAQQYPTDYVYPNEKDAERYMRYLEKKKAEQSKQPVAPITEVPEKVSSPRPVPTGRTQFESFTAKGYPMVDTDRNSPTFGKTITVPAGYVGGSDYEHEYREKQHGGSQLPKHQVSPGETGSFINYNAALNQANSSFQPSSTRTSVPATVAMKRDIDTGKVAANKKAAEEARAREIASGKGKEKMFGVFDIPVTYSGIERQNAETLGKKKLAAETVQGDVYQNLLELGSSLIGTGALNQGTNLLSPSSKVLAKDAPILNEYRNIEQLRLANSLKSLPDIHVSTFGNTKNFEKIRQESKQLLDKYDDEFTKLFGKGSREDKLIYAGLQETKKLPNQGFLVGDDYAKATGLNTDISTYDKFLGDVYQLEFSEYFNRPDNTFKTFLNDEFQNLIQTNKLKSPSTVVRGSHFNRKVPTLRNDTWSDIHYDDLQVGDVIKPGHNWSTSTDRASSWGAQKALVNLSEGQSAYRPNMFKGSVFPDEQELVLPKDLQYRLIGINPSFGKGEPRFIFDVANTYRQGGSKLPSHLPEAYKTGGSFESDPFDLLKKYQAPTKDRSNEVVYDDKGKVWQGPIRTSMDPRSQPAASTVVVNPSFPSMKRAVEQMRTKQETAEQKPQEEKPQTPLHKSFLDSKNASLNARDNTNVVLRKPEEERRIAAEKAERERIERMGVIYEKDPLAQQKQNVGLSLGMPSPEAAYVGVGKDGVGPATIIPQAIGTGVAAAGAYYGLGALGQAAYPYVGQPVSRFFASPTGKALNLGFGAYSLSNLPQSTMTAVDDPSLSNLAWAGLDWLGVYSAAADVPWALGQAASGVNKIGKYVRSGYDDFMWGPSTPRIPSDMPEVPAVVDDTEELISRVRNTMTDKPYYAEWANPSNKGVRTLNTEDEVLEWEKKKHNYEKLYENYINSVFPEASEGATIPPDIQDEFFKIYGHLMPEKVYIPPGTMKRPYALTWDGRKITPDEFNKHVGAPKWNPNYFTVEDMMNESQLMNKAKFLEDVTQRGMNLADWKKLDSTLPYIDRYNKVKRGEDAISMLAKNDPHGLLMELRGFGNMLPEVKNMSLDEIKNLSDNEARTLADRYYDIYVKDEERFFKSMLENEKKAAGKPLPPGFFDLSPNKFGGTSKKGWLEQYQMVGEIKPGSTAKYHYD